MFHISRINGTCLINAILAVINKDNSISVNSLQCVPIIYILICSYQLLDLLLCISDRHVNHICSKLMDSHKSINNQIWVVTQKQYSYLMKTLRFTLLLQQPTYFYRSRVLIWIYNPTDDEIFN